ncbi:MAG: hypothetical protein EHM31_01295 [Candidatus Aminicenantes bacterium]|nr:MAG: hypothetical protein EHM31_01295 [Candidatus Aminicenantes bacterium]
MGRITMALGTMGLVVGLALNVEAGEERKVQIALTGTFMMGERFDGEFGGFIGPGVRLDLNLDRLFMISPEAMWLLYWSSVAPACTLNLRFGPGFAGLGPMATWATDDGHGIGLLKAHLGIKDGHALFEVFFVKGAASLHTGGASPALIGLTFGVVF